MKLTDKAQESLAKVIQKFQSGDLSPIRDVVRIKLDPNAPARKWSLSNRVLAFIQAEELDCRAYGQWIDIGRNVKKGAHAVYIVRPLMVHILKSDNREEDERVCLGFSTIPVFKASDTEGENALPKYTPDHLPPLLLVAMKFGISVAFVPTPADRLGDSSTDGTHIRIGSHDPSIFFHELAHAIHAKIGGQLQAGQQVEQETIAEFTSAVLMDLYELGDHSGNAWRYISQYADNPLVAITKALSTVEKVLQTLID